MTEHILHIRAAKGVDGRTLGLTGSVMDVVQNQSIPLTPYEVGEIATVLNGHARLKGERVVYLHQDNTPERTVSGTLVDLRHDQPLPLSSGDAERIAEVVRRIEEIEASSLPEQTKQLKRIGFQFGPPVRAKDKNQI